HMGAAAPGTKGPALPPGRVPGGGARRPPEIPATVGPVPSPPGMGDEATGAADLGPAVAGAPDEAPVTEGSRARPARSLSPSRAGDFLTCPLLYRFRVIDRLPEPPTPPAGRGTRVH